jgi:hypothetical protein
MSALPLYDVVQLIRYTPGDAGPPADVLAGPAPAEPVDGLSDSALAFLINAGFLVRTATGNYIRSAASPVTADRIEALQAL